MTAAVSQKPSVNVVSEEEHTPLPPAFPPYPPYATVPAPPSVADTIVAGRDLRLLHKSLPKKPVRPLPKPAKPKGPAAGDLKLSRRRLRAHAQCLRKHNVVLSDRLEHMARPQRRAVMYLWRDHGHHLPPETIARMRAMLDADEPFKPAQAYEYFINQRKSTKRQKELKAKSIKKGIQPICGDKRHAWARNATVMFARGIQHRLSKPGSIVLTDGMLRLSNIILGEIFGFLHIKKPSRRSTHPKARFIMDISDRIAIWIDDILSEADDRMLMMDFDEDDEVEHSTVDERVMPSSVASRTTVISSVHTTTTLPASTGATPSASKSKVDISMNNKVNHFPGDSFNIIGDVVLPREQKPAYLKFGDESLEAFNILVDTMNKKGDQQLIDHRSFRQTYKEASDSLKNATNLEAREFDSALVDQLRQDLAAAVSSTTTVMKDIINICSEYLAEQAGINNATLPHVKSRDSEKNATSLKKLKESLSDTNPSLCKNLEDNGRIVRKKSLAVNKNRNIDNIKETVSGSKSLPDIKLLSGSRIKTDGHDNISTMQYKKSKDSALKILHNQLLSHGDEIFHEQQPTTLTHSQASDWLSKDTNEDKIVPDVEDINHLSKIFTKKFDDLVNKATPQNIVEAMQGVVNECSRKLAEQFLNKNYKTIVEETLISEMQNKGNDILMSIDGDTETTFFAAQRLKKAKCLNSKEPNKNIVRPLIKKLEDIIRCKPIAPKLLGTMQEHIEKASNYLSVHILKPDSDIEAYIILLEAMDAAGNARLVEGAVTLTYSDASKFLMHLTSFDDKINKPNPSLQSEVENKLNSAVGNLSHNRFDKNAMKGVINNSARLLVSYITLQGEKTSALKLLLQIMKNEGGDNVLLRHGNICTTYLDAIDLLRDKNISELSVADSDSIVMLKIQTKLEELMSGKSSSEKHLMNDVIAEVSKYLAVRLISQPQPQKVCLCKKNVHVQCEMWSKYMLKKVSKRCLYCNLNVQKQTLPEPGSEKEIYSQALDTSTSHSCGPIISVKHCPAPEMKSTDSTNDTSCPARDPKCTASYLLFISSNPPNRKTMPAKSNTQAFKLKSNENKSEIKETLIKDIYANSNYKYVENKDKDQTADASKILDKTVNTPKYHTNTDNIILQSGASDIENIHAYIISSNHISELQALLTGIIWNLHIWGHWVQEIIDLAVNCHLNENWIVFKDRVLNETLQWLQYNKFIRKLTQNLCERNKNRRVVSPTRTLKNRTQYNNYEDIDEVINISFKWIQWLSTNIKQADSLKINSELKLNALKWDYFRAAIKEYLIEWVKCCLQLKCRMDKNFRNIISDFSLKSNNVNPLWIISAYGVVPSGATEAGVSDDEVIWVARTIYDNMILPAALHPSKHHCVIYVEGKTIFNTKYQVLCNAKANWLPWRAGFISPRAVTVVPEVFIGRVQYRGSHLIGPVYSPKYHCRVGVFGRTVAFNCYELLVC